MIKYKSQPKPVWWEAHLKLKEGVKLPSVLITSVEARAMNEEEARAEIELMYGDKYETVSICKMDAHSAIGEITKGAVTS